jgi:hypothetical protein
MNMNFEIEKYVSKKQNIKKRYARKFDQCWALDLVTNKPVIFEVLNIDFLYGRTSNTSFLNMKPGIFVKISVDWVSMDFMNESFWVEITNVNINSDGEIHMFGTCANNTERVGYGSIVGPIYTRNIVQVEEK